ncbi:hypothetical protein [Caldisericum sp.]|uniref:hypothetical protein n=1 Tax=Caldisericum sp. TaxID=2499687 RepID=UPI003D13AEBD
MKIRYPVPWRRPYREVEVPYEIAWDEEIREIVSDEVKFLEPVMRFLYDRATLNYTDYYYIADHLLDEIGRYIETTVSQYPNISLRDLIKYVAGMVRDYMEIYLKDEIDRFIRNTVNRYSKYDEVEAKVREALVEVYNYCLKAFRDIEPYTFETIAETIIYETDLLEYLDEEVLDILKRNKDISEKLFR